LGFDNERRQADALVLRFVVACGSGGAVAIGRGVVGIDDVYCLVGFAVVVVGVGVVAASLAICGSGVEGASDVDEVGGVVQDAIDVAVVGSGVSVAGVGGVDKADVVVEVVVVIVVGNGDIEGAGAFAGDGAVCDAKGWGGEGVEVGTASRGGAGGGDDVANVVEVVAAVGGGVGVDDASGVVVGAAAVDGGVGVGDAGVASDPTAVAVIGIERVRIAVVRTQGLRGTSTIGGGGLPAVEAEWVR